MERVQYHLERLLPSLQLLSTLGLCTDKELQALTQQRRQHETQLITRGVTLSHYLEYVKLEEKFERLIQIRVARSGKDIRWNEVVTLKDHNKIKRFQERHILSVWQRAVAKLGPSDSDVFCLYLQWLQGRKMRRVYSEIAAQALSLHSRSTSLWIQVADWELNSNLDASAARLTLLRGIRFNTFIESDIKRKAAANKFQKKKRRKRARRLEREDTKGANEDEGEGEGEGASSSRSSERDESEDESATAPQASTSTSVAAPSLMIPQTLPPSSYQLLNLWLNYFRMECVFLERLRRRWEVLGIDGAGRSGTETVREKSENEKSDIDGYASQGESESDDDVSPTGNGDALRKLQTGDGNDGGSAKINQAAQRAVPTKILSGALLLTILTSALRLDRQQLDAMANFKESSSPSLPSELHFLFLHGVFRFLSKFPFASTAGHEGEELRASLVKSIFQALSQSSLGRVSQIFSLMQHTTCNIMAARWHAARLQRVEDEEGRSREELEKRSNERLRSASRLRFGSEAESSLRSWVSERASLSAVFSGALDGDAFASNVLTALEEEVSHNEKRHTLDALRAQNVVLRQTMDDIRETQLLAQECSSAKTSTLIRQQLAEAIRTFLQKEVSMATALLRLRLTCVVWQSLAYQCQLPKEDGEVEGEALASVTDPLLPFVSELLIRAFKKASRTTVGAANVQARILFLVFRYQAAVHASSQKSLSDSGDQGVKNWSQVDIEASAVLSDCPSVETFTPLLVYIRASIWENHWKWQRMSEESIDDVLSVLEEAQKFWTSILGLCGKKASQHVSAQWRTVELLLGWIRSEFEEGRGVYSDLARDIVQATKRGLLTSLGSSAASQSIQKVQAVHDQALLTLWFLARGVNDRNRMSDVATPAAVVALWRDQNRTSPSLSAWCRLAEAATIEEGSSAQLAIYQHLEQLALSTSSVVQREQEFLELFAVLFRHYLRKGDVRNSLALLKKAIRRGKGEERWQQAVEGAWEQENKAAEAERQKGGEQAEHEEEEDEEKEKEARNPEQV